jgi:hypothetical protein
MVDRFKEKTLDYRKIFGLKVANGFIAKGDFTALGIDQNIVLTREFVQNVTQPGRTGITNPTTGAVLSYKQRKASLLPAKVDLYIDELELYKLRTSFLSEAEPGSATDINSLAGRNYIMGKVMEQIGKEVNNAVFKGALGFNLDSTNQSTINASRFQGGLNLADGFGLKFLTGYASGSGQDIPGANKVVGAASTFTATNALAELTKIEDILYNESQFDELVYNDDPSTPDTKLFMPATYKRAIVQALDNLSFKNDQLVFVDAQGALRFKKAPKVVLEAKRWMAGVNNMFLSPKDNLFFLHQMAGVDVPMIKFQEFDRGIKILIDWEMAFEYADGRAVLLYK